MLRIGCVKYLNARPLIYGWSGAVDFDHPAALCRKLERGDLEVALVSSLEYLRRPIYRIIDGVSISARGAVYSVIVAHNEDLSRAEEIEIDPASETSVALLRCLLRQRGLNPRLRVRKTDLESVRPAELYSAESEAASGSVEVQTADSMSAGRTGQRPVFRPFDEQGELHRSRRNLPHWQQEGAIVAEALRHFDSQRYHLDAFVVMPNHVHALVQPLPGHSLKEILRSWKSYSARQINKTVGRSGSVDRKST